MKRIGFPSLILALILISGTSLRGSFAANPVSAPAALPSATSAQRDAIVPKLQSALSDSVKQLGTLEPWQLKIFQEEILPLSNRFIRDYRLQDKKVLVDVDLESIRNYLKFYGPKYFKKPAPEILVLLNPEQGCDLCAAQFEEIRKTVSARIERRGFKPLWPTREQVDPKLGGKALDELAGHLANQAKAAGSIVVEWRRLVGDDVDTAHADELRFQIRSVLALHELPKHEGQIEIFDTGNFDKSVVQLLTDFFSDIGSKAEKAPIHLADQEKDGFTVSISGIRDFAHYNQIKSAVLALSVDELVIEEQKISRGTVVFSVITEKKIEEVRKILATLSGSASFAGSEVEVR